ncbi:MAG TPA: hypothetical protein VFX33_03410 [Actinomycetales bacterium]|nr:hypothetical protein [Actinomycetales bacterium]
MARNTPARIAHDVGLAAWFGGTLANAVALNPAAGKAADPSSSGRVANTGWDRWTPVNAAAIGLHLGGAAALLVANKGRVVGQKGVLGMSIAKTALTVAALGATGYSRLLGRRVSQETSVPVQSGTEPAASTPEPVAQAQAQLRILQWVVPALTGAVVGISSYAGEQQRETELKKGMLGRLGLH